MIAPAFPPHRVTCGHGLRTALAYAWAAAIVLVGQLLLVLAVVAHPYVLLPLSMPFGILLLLPVVGLYVWGVSVVAAFVAGGDAPYARLAALGSQLCWLAIAVYGLR